MGFQALILFVLAPWFEGNHYEEIHFADPGGGLKLITGELKGEGEDQELWILKPVGSEAQVSVLEIIKPKIQTAAYAIQGELTYEMSEPGYLEMLNYFEDKGTFFTRSMSEDGPMRRLKGQSDWRFFILPFYRNNQGDLKVIEIPPPEKLGLNFNAPGSAKIGLRHLKLVNLRTEPDFTYVENQWWSSRQSGLLFGILGSILGIIYGLMSYNCARGKHRNMVASSLASMAILGMVSLVSAFWAAFEGQPRHVLWPLFLTGFLLLAFLLFFRPLFRAKYQASELRKMESRDS